MITHIKYLLTFESENNYDRTIITIINRAKITRYQDFWATAREDWCVLFVGPRLLEEFHGYLMAHNSQLARGFKENKFGSVELQDS